MDLNHARLPIPPRGRCIACYFYCLLDVAAEFRYDIRLCHFAPDQLSFAFCRAATDSHRFVAGWAVFEESESIADQLKMSKGHEKIIFLHDVAGAIPAPTPSTFRMPG
jgi:hypothetical protein